MNLHKLSLLLLLLLPAAGCRHGAISPETLPQQIRVFAVQLHTDSDYREINGDVATEEPCLKGYDRSFGRLQITVGYDFNGHIRKIATRNPSTAIFGISPGMTFAAAGQLISAAGFVPYIPPYVFRNGSYLLSLQVGSHDRIDGLALETLD